MTDPRDRGRSGELYALDGARRCAGSAGGKKSDDQERTHGKVRMAMMQPSADSGILPPC